MPRTIPRAGPGLAAALVGTLAALLVQSCSRPPEPLPRNAIVVVFDTLRADRMSVYGYARPTTPYLESRTAEWVRFDRVKAPAPWTLPSHASLFTGLWPSQHGVHWGNKWLDDRYDTLAESLQSAGFCTFGLSANPIVSEKTGLNQGFDRYKKVPAPPETQTARLLALIPDLLERARRRDCRLFLFANLMETHTPFNSARFAAEFGAEALDPISGPKEKWEVAAGLRTFSPAERRLHEASYDAAVRSVDATVAELIALLEVQGFLEDSILVLTSDHGEGLGAHRELGHVISVWEEQLAIPLLVRFPHGRRGGTVIAGPTSLVRLAPTLLDWLGVARPEALATAPELESELSAVADYRSYFDPAFALNLPMAKLYPGLAESVPDAHVTYCPPFKLIVRSNRTAELYDVEHDPAETRDLAPEQPDDLRACVATYRQLAHQGRFMPFDRDLETGRSDGVDEDTLRSLGYLQ
jgi:arylsulfatase A-like enzyme